MLDLWHETNGRLRAWPRPNASTSRCRAAARMGPSPGACSTGCWKRRDRDRGHLGHLRRRAQRGGGEGGAGAGRRAAARENLAWLWEQVGAITDPRITPWLEAVAPSRRQQRDRGLPALRRRRQRLAHGQPLRRRAVLPEPAAGGSWNGSITTRSAAIPGPAFHICATNVRTGKIRVFTGDDIGPEAIMASACLPTLFKAVEIPDGDRDGWRPIGTAAIPATPRSTRCSRPNFPAISWW
jgi:hypothetical protein